MQNVSQEFIVYINHLQ